MKTTKRHFRAGLFCLMPGSCLQDVGISRIQAIAALGRLGASNATDKISNLLLDRNEDINVRANACIALGNLGDKESEALLHEMLTDIDEFVAGCAQRGLKIPMENRQVRILRSRETT